MDTTEEFMESTRTTFWTANSDIMNDVANTVEYILEKE